LKKPTILLADDHPHFPELTKNLLAPAFEVIGSVCNGRALIEVSLEMKPDVIITDISMPVLNGIEAVVRLKSLGSRSSVIFLTVHSDPDFVRACFATGASGFVIKPQAFTQLLTAISEVLAGRTFVSPPLSHLGRT
jgi:DNA-binding NarL/FixJ family response regulator